MGGWALLDGAMAEMATGEGKTITAALPAAAAALAGSRCMSSPSTITSPRVTPRRSARFIARSA